MKRTDQQRAELRALAKDVRSIANGCGSQRSFERMCEASEAITALSADLEETGASINQGRQLLREEMQRSSERGEQILKLEAELAATRQQLEQYKRDADDWGGALNDASWKLIETFPGGMTSHQFNNCKAVLRAAIQAYFESIDAALSAKEKSNG